MKLSLPLGSYKNIPVFIHWTFSILILWVIVSNYRQGMPPTNILWVILLVLTLFFCVVLHEFGHALAAQKYGIQTKDIVLYPIGGIARLEKILNSQATHFVVVKDEVAVGTLSRNEIIQGLQDHGNQSKIEQVANFAPLKLDTEEDLSDAWREMLIQQKKVAFVIENGHFLGILDQENISEFMMVKKAMAPHLHN